MCLHTVISISRVQRIKKADIETNNTSQNHLPSLRLFAIHSIIDTSFAALATLVIASVTFSPSVSTKLGHAVCEHLSRGDALGIVYSPGSGLEACEEKWSYGIAPVLLLLAAIALFFRSKTAHYIYNYYRRAAFDGRISLESPSIVTPTLHHPTYSSIPMKGRSNTTSSTSSTSSSLSSGRHSRSSSASTVRPGTASRIMLLPIDFKTSSSPSQKAAFPILQVTPPTPSSLVPSSSLSECPDTPKLSSTHNPPEKTRTGSRSNHGNVIVYAPILMSVEEAHQLGGREAVIATALSSSPNSGRVGSVGTRHRQHSPPSNRRTPTPPANISEDNNQPATPFAAIKGFRDSTEMEEMSNHRNKLL